MGSNGVLGRARAHRRQASRRHLPRRRWSVMSFRRGLRQASVAVVLALMMLVVITPMGLGEAATATPAPTKASSTPVETTAQRVAAASAAQAPPAASQPVEVPPGGFRGRHVVSEVLGRRTPASRTYTTAQGELLGFFWPAPIEYRDAAGTWHLVDPSLVASPGGGWHNAGDAAIAELPANLSSPIAVQTVSSTVSLGLDGAQAPGSVSATTVSYPGALPGVDVSYRSQSGSLKETLTLAGPASQRAFSFTATTTAGLSINPRPDGGLGISDGEGAGVVGLSAPTMLDAAGAVSHAISLTARRDGGVWHLVVVPDASWLDAPGRAWPVAVDPTVSFTESGANDTYLSSASPTTSFGTASTFQIGHNSSNGENDRALIRFPDLGGSRLTDVKIVDASLTISQVGHTGANAQSISLYPATKAWTSSATWSTYDGTNAWTSAGGDWSTPAADTRSGGTSNVNWVFYPRAAVQSWFNFATANNGFELVSNEAVDNQMTFTSWDSATSSQWPVLSVQYTATSGLAASQSFPVTHRITDREQLKVNARATWSSPPTTTRWPASGSTSACPASTTPAPTRKLSTTLRQPFRKSSERWRQLPPVVV